jgi:hypothetical protein
LPIPSRQAILLILATFSFSFSARADYDICSEYASQQAYSSLNRILTVSVTRLQRSNFPAPIRFTAQHLAHNGEMPAAVEVTVVFDPEATMPSQAPQNILLTDDGLNGDATPNDGVYSASATLDSPPLQTISLKVTATFTNQTCSAAGPVIDVVDEGECLTAMQTAAAALQRQDRGTASSYFVWNSRGRNVIATLTDAQLPALAAIFKKAQLASDSGTSCKITLQSVDRGGQPAIWNLSLTRMPNLGWQVTRWE